MTDTGRPTRYRFAIFGLIVLIALINYIDRGAIAYSATQIIGEYGFDKAGWGAVLGYFGYGYMFGALIGGALSDRVGAKRVWVIAGVAWSVFAIAMIWAGDLGIAVMGGSALAGFATIRILFGFAEGPAYSIINKTMSTWAAPSERGFAVSIGLLSTPLGALLTAPVAVGLLMLTDSWRTMYVILGVLGFVLIALFAWVYTNKPEDHPKVNAAELALIQAGRPPAQKAEDLSGAYPWWSFFKSRTLVFNSIGYFSFIYVNFMLLTWTPKYLSDEFHFTLSSLWYVGMIPWTGACITVLLGGRISDWLFKRTGNLKIARSYFAASALVLTTICFILVSQVHTVGAVIALMTLGNALNALPNSVYWAVVIDTAPSPSRVGTFSGIMHFLANIAAVLAPTLAGILSARYGYSSMFVATAVATALGVFAMLQVRPGVGPAPVDGSMTPAKA
ncbi:MFS transporter [Cupriavidus pauculus]|uniref:MFS transporter n=1 Tax=Cupriavidus pauculus TaxID=82633 RepID=A0A2N5CDJ2_9BURK|nr:MFS transporter [Cupriavidus pauculus]PLQ00262.1 MFS transporter [Cupriavidus pauculus]